jgi:hypothetical protein
LPPDEIRVRLDFRNEIRLLDVVFKFPLQSIGHFLQRTSLISELGQTHAVREKKPLNPESCPLDHVDQLVEKRSTGGNSTRSTVATRALRSNSSGYLEAKRVIPNEMTGRLTRSYRARYSSIHSCASGSAACRRCMTFELMAGSP